MKKSSCLMGPVLFCKILLLPPQWWSLLLREKVQLKLIFEIIAGVYGLS
mgnify:CR=1 FL=1